MRASQVPAGQIFYHGTKADLRVGDLIGPGFGSNFVERALKHIYFSATLDAATWGAELAKGEGRGRIYIIGPTGPTRNSRAMSPPPTAASSRCASPARSRAGSAIAPSSFRRCGTAWRG